MFKQPERDFQEHTSDWRFHRLSVQFRHLATICSAEFPHKKEMYVCTFTSGPSFAIWKYYMKTISLMMCKDRNTNCFGHLHPYLTMLEVKRKYSIFIQSYAVKSSWSVLFFFKGPRTYKGAVWAVTSNYQNNILVIWHDRLQS